MSEKITQNEQAEKQSNALVENGLSKIEKPPRGVGLPWCMNCDEEIPMARRLAYGNGLCVDCAEFME